MNSIKVLIYSNDGNSEEEYEFPAKYEVCSRCRGEGSHTNPNIDGNGITSSEWEEMCDDDPDFPDHYMSGMYDVQCEECNGLRVKLIVDEERLSDSQKADYKIYCEQQREIRQMEADDRRTQRMESGEW